MCKECESCGEKRERRETGSPFEYLRVNSPEGAREQSPEGAFQEICDADFLRGLVRFQ